MRICRALSALLVAISLLSCQAADVQPTALPGADRETRPEIVLAGSTAMYPVLEALVASYEQAEPAASIWLETTRWHDGVEAVRSGSADIGLWASDPPPTDTLSITVPIALDAVAIIVHPDNPVSDLTLDDLRLAYAGRVFTWDILGGSAVDVQPVSHAPGTDNMHVFEAKVMRGTAMTLQTVLVPNSEGMLDYVANHQGAVGYVSLAWVDQRVKAVTIQGVAATAAAIQDGRYPLVRPLWLLAGDDLTAAGRAFMAYCLSPAGQEIVSQFHIPVR